MAELHSLKTLAVQLYSVREHLKEDFEATLEKIAAMGYVGVETYPLPEGITPEHARRVFDSLGLVVCGSHSPLPLGPEKSQVLDTMAALGGPYLVSPRMDPSYYQTDACLRELAERFNQALQVCQENDLRLGVHNHDFEFRLLGRKPAMLALREYLDPAVLFELDTYWILIAGQDPVQMVSEFGERAPLLHLKDGPGLAGAAYTAIGDGALDVPGIIKAGDGNTEWLIVEIDRCETDMFTALEKSLHYLTVKGLGRARV